MITFALRILLELAFVVQTSPLHGAPRAQPTPVPHWVVLLAVVPALWLLIGGIVLVIDRLFQRVGERGQH